MSTTYREPWMEPALLLAEARPVYRRGDGIDALLHLQLWIAARQDRHHCSVCGRHIGWFYGFPFPLCCWCVDKRTGPVQLSCPPTPWAGCDRAECQS